MNTRLKPYEGKEPYAFVSYSHKDSEIVLSILGRLQNEGLRIWYDEGIECGTEWPAYIAEHIIGCKCILAFISENSKDSRHCRREIHYAIDKEKDVIPIYLEKIELDPGSAMELTLYQAIHFYQYPSDKMENFYSRLLKSEFLKSCYAQKKVKISGVVRVIPEERIVPIVFILDTSGSMYGRSIEILSKSMKEMLENLRDYSINTKWETSCGSRTIYVSYKISIITFDSEARILMNYTDVEDINNLPEFVTNGMTSLGKALKLAKTMIEDTTVTLDHWQNPVTILVMDGEPNDDYLSPLVNFTTEGNSAHCKKYAIGIGDSVNRKTLRIFAVDPILTKSDLELEQAFKIITNYITGVVYL